MTRDKMPPIAHKLYAIGLIVIVVFVIIAWAVTAVSVSAKTLANIPEHQGSLLPESCTTCHQTSPVAPRIPHIAMPTCGYCHRSTNP